MNYSLRGLRNPFVVLLLAVAILLITTSLNVAGFQQEKSITPILVVISRQQERLSDADPEVRRDALMNLGVMHRPEASRAALVGLSDTSPMVRAVAAHAILSIGSDESAAALLPLLSDKAEFVRQEVAYSLGQTGSRSATTPLTELLLNDKRDSVRAAAAVALGNLRDENAVVALANVLAPGMNSAKKKTKTEKNVFVLRSAAKALGQIGSRAGVGALVSALSNEKQVDDVRREAATALGLIGDPAAVPALKSAANSSDPYLAQQAYAALQKITR